MLAICLNFHLPALQLGARQPYLHLPVSGILLAIEILAGSLRVELPLKRSSLRLIPLGQLKQLHGLSPTPLLKFSKAAGICGGIDRCSGRLMGDYDRHGLCRQRASAPQ